MMGQLVKHLLEAAEKELIEWGRPMLLMMWNESITSSPLRTCGKRGEIIIKHVAINMLNEAVMIMLQFPESLGIVF